jgi:hypothetical protein
MRTCLKKALSAPHLWRDKLERATRCSCRFVVPILEVTQVIGMNARMVALHITSLMAARFVVIF